MNLYRCAKQRSFEDALEHVWLVPPADLLPKVPSSWLSQYNDLPYPYTVPVGESPGGAVLVDTTAGPAYVRESDLKDTPLVAPQWETFNSFRLPMQGYEMDSGSRIPSSILDPSIGTRNNFDPLLRVSDLVINREMPAITGAPDQVEAHSQHGGCAINEWVAANPVMALGLVLGAYFLLKGNR